MADDIVLGRHRYYRRSDRGGDWWSDSGMVGYRQADALDEIERLRAEVDRLKGGVDFDCFLNVDACPDGALYDANGERVWDGGGVLFARREDEDRG